MSYMPCSLSVMVVGFPNACQHFLYEKARKHELLLFSLFQIDSAFEKIHLLLASPALFHFRLAGRQ